MVAGTRTMFRAWPIEKIEASFMAQLFQCTLPEAKRRLGTIKKQHADREWLDRLFERLPVPALALLAVLADHAGECERLDLMTEAMRRFEVTPAEIDAAVPELFRELLVVGLSAGRAQMLALVSSVAEAVAERVRDLDLAPLEGATFTPGSSAGDGRAWLATCAALAHHEVKLTQQGLPHLGGVKRLAKSLGLSPGEVDPMLVLGLELGVVRPEEGDVLRPEPAAMLDAARGRFQNRAVMALLEGLHATGPVSIERVARWRQHAVVALHVAVPGLELLGWLPGVQQGRIGQVPAFAAVSHLGTAAAMITPSFEVVLPPESSLAHVVTVLRYAEPTRIDRAIVARITKASIQRAVSAGHRCDALLDELTAASRTPIPQNVEAAVRDWADGIVAAVTAVGRVIVVPPGDEQRVLAALRDLAPRSLAPGVIVMDRDVGVRVVSTALTSIGVVSRSVPIGIATPTPRGPARPEVAVPPLQGGDPVLQRRVAAYRAEDPTKRARVASVSAADADAPDDASIEALETWEATHAPLADDLANVVVALLDVIDDADRAHLLGARDARQLEQRAHEVLRRGGAQRFFERNADLVEQIMPPAMVEALGLRRAPAGDVSAPATERARGVVWSTEDLAARLAELADVNETCLLDTGGDRPREVRVSRIIKQGRVSIVLAESEDGEAVAVPLSTIRRVGKLPAGDAPRQPWRPLPGQAAPAGHVACPCGSGVRYRSCCRVAD